MSTTANSPDATQAAWQIHPILRRFVWKEFRMLRGLWAAVAIMGLLVQCAERMLLPYTPGFPLMLLYTALSAAVLYAVGAASTSFSVEHEEQTHDLLTRLPTTWWPPFAGKLLVTFISALLLAFTLSIPALLLHGFQLLTDQDAHGALGMMGFAIVEAIAWGTFFSLLIKRPLPAAIITLVVGVVAVNIAVNVAASTHADASFSPVAYVEAIPLRLTVVVAMFAASIALARNWLMASAILTASARLGAKSRIAGLFATAIARWRSDTAAVRGSNRRMLSRLLWQTWRENWKLLLFPVGAGLFLFAGVGSVIGLTHPPGEIGSLILTLTLLFVPTLYGAMAFYADQRRASVRFLAEHAARPRYVWFARNSLWLGSFVAIWIFLMICSVLWMLLRISWDDRQFLDNYFLWGRDQIPNAPYLLYEASNSLATVLRVAGLAFFGALLAYGIGQFCSMAMRSEILAAFISLLLSTLVVAWTTVAYLWQLSAWLFLLPLFASFMLAAWLRAPDWIAGRNSPRSWLKPAVAVALPILLIGLFLPTVRLSQLPTTFGDNPRKRVVVADTVAEQLGSFQAKNTSDARATAQMYVTAAERLDSGVALPNLLERWDKPQYYEDSSIGPAGAYVDIDPKKIPADQLPAFLAAREKQDKMYHDARMAMIELALTASKRPTCRFDFPVQPPPPSTAKSTPPASRTPNDRRSKLGYSYPLYFKLDRLLDSIASDDSFDRLLAALRMSAHLRSGQPTAFFLDQLAKEQSILRSIDTWASQKTRTKAELQDALSRLNGFFEPSPSLEGPLLADHLLIRDVITGAQPPLIQNTLQPLRDYLAFLANRLPWERQRALKALDRITLRNTREANSFANRLDDSRPREIGAETWRRWLRPQYTALPELWELEEPAATTSYLMSLEYKARVEFSQLCRARADDEVCRRATLLQLGLAMYRLDHNKYPTHLSDLVPEYLYELPLDPYARQSFQYSSSGLSLSLKFSRTEYDYQEIEPGTPLFWSVGAGSVRLIVARTQVADETAVPQPEGEPIRPPKLEPQYQFVNEDSGWTATFVFPLPEK